MLPVPERKTKVYPIKLKGVLARHGILQKEWAEAIIQDGVRAGLGLSSTAAAMILNNDAWPIQTPKESIKKQTEVFLRSRSVLENEIKLIWDHDSNDEYRYYKPAGRSGYNGHPKQSSHPELLDELPEVEMLTETARKHFQIFKNPFIDDIQNPDDVFLSPDNRYIREAMFTTAKHGGMIAVIGESGAGKSTLRRDLIDRIQRESHPITVIQPRIIDKGRLTAGHICDAIIRDISQESLGGGLEAKARKIERLLIGSSRAGNSHVLIIEEAHDLHINTLKYLKRFWEIEDGFRKLLAIILIGQPELKDKLDIKQNWHAREIINRCEIAELQPLNGDLEKYLELKFHRIGAKLNDLFEKDAFEAIRQRLTVRRRGNEQTVSMHYPLIVNSTVIKCMNLAAEMGAKKVNADIVSGV